MTKIAVGYGWESPFVYADWAENALEMRTPPGCELKWLRGRGWCSARMHIDVCERALEWDADYICFYGTDQLHPPDMFEKLVKNVDQRRAIAALVPTRGDIFHEGMKKFQPVAFTGDLNDMKLYEPNGNDLERITVTGSGVFMFPARILNGMSKPWFVEQLKDSERYIREANCDTAFCYRILKEQAVETWVDNTIHVKHLNIFPIGNIYHKEEETNA
jgi:hypothetical protein